MKSRASSNPLEIPARTRPEQGDGPTLAVERGLLRGFWRLLGCPDIQLRLWDGSTAGSAASGSPVCRIGSRRAFWSMLAAPTLAVGDGYSSGDIEFDGDLVRIVEAVFSPPRQQRMRKWLRRGLLDVPAWGSSNSLTGSRRNIQHHYDLGNEFYRLWLDDSMSYTCAYFPESDMTLEAAQRAKMDHVCRKLQLKPGDEVIEAGCGWGALAIHMAVNYGVSVRAFNISGEQIAEARRRVEAAGCGDRVTIEQQDYRDISGSCDAFVSVGMLEHVGRRNYAALGDVIARCLRPHGRGLLHSIGQVHPRPMSGWAARRIFPGAYAPTLAEMLSVLRPGAFAPLDVENLRLHYAETLRHWLARFEQHAGEIESMYDAAFVRAWRLYLASSVAQFNIGGLHLYQVLFAWPANDGVPLTRAHLYS